MSNTYLPHRIGAVDICKCRKYLSKKNLFRTPQAYFSIKNKKGGVSHCRLNMQYKFAWISFIVGEREKKNCIGMTSKGDGVKKRKIAASWGAQFRDKEDGRNVGKGNRAVALLAFSLFIIMRICNRCIKDS